MKTEDFDYDLPAELIAQYPLENRTDSRLLMLNRQTGEIVHRCFTDLLTYLQSGDLLVMNNSRVIRARLFAQKPTGAKVELLVERVLSPMRFLAHLKANKSLNPGQDLVFADQTIAQIESRSAALFEISLPEHKSIWQLMEALGHMPLPPYMNRSDDISDQTRYQTVYAQHNGSVAAPTAGLHFDQALLDQLQEKGVQCDYVTLHVGAGTFQPVRVDDVKSHHMHAEYIEVSAELCAKIAATKAAGKRVVAVGTTTVRALETAAQSGGLKPYQGDTDIFIYPGFAFRFIDAMITNFHLPKSTLLMLVSAFSSQAYIFQAYQAAIAEGYRFFSYGDAMWIG